MRILSDVEEKSGDSLELENTNDLAVEGSDRVGVVFNKVGEDV